ncbi:hypothetical protein [Alicyclobacillus ferrooxydans]|uniref:Uncharacterized protein n=1 Tax=Alicyclobacillus ferrooxydans TaxID=471514 RepID=A0A0P9EZJ2_9BACL|nr:hypothetical protein [Alicyclobacillus ferrooxydans]KPV44515.1 hypothetical protein AN477_06750 [Alicyclobacillus ferrooxydans]
MSDNERDKKKLNRVVGYAAMDDGGPGGLGYEITEDDVVQAQKIYGEIFGDERKRKCDEAKINPE